MNTNTPPPSPYQTPRDIITRFVAMRYDKPTRVADIASEIGLEIIEGVYAPGDQIDSVTLAKRFNSSRTPVREALMLLEKEGLIEIPPRRRPFVPEFDPKSLQENYKIRALLMGDVMEDLAHSATTEDLSQMHERFDAMEVASGQVDGEKYFWANVDFHELAAKLVGNKTLSGVLDSLFLRALQFRRFSLSVPGRRERSLEDHRRLMSALEERDSLLAKALVQSIILGAYETLREIISRLPDGQKNTLSFQTADYGSIEESSSE